MGQVLVRRDGPVGTVVLSNLGKFNAMTVAMGRSCQTPALGFAQGR